MNQARQNPRLSQSLPFGEEERVCPMIISESGAISIRLINPILLFVPPSKQVNPMLQIFVIPLTLIDDGMSQHNSLFITQPKPHQVARVCNKSVVSMGLRLQEKSYYRVRGRRDKTCGGDGRRGTGRIQLQGLQGQRRTRDRRVGRRFHIARSSPPPLPSDRRG